MGKRYKTDAVRDTVREAKRAATTAKRVSRTLPKGTPRLVVALLVLAVVVGAVAIPRVLDAVQGGAGGSTASESYWSASDGNVGLGADGGASRSNVDVSFAAQQAANLDAVDATDTQLANTDPATFREGEVVRVVDGDTLIVNVNGQDERVRLVGVNTPESVHTDENRNTEEGRQASDHMKTLLQPGDRVWLQRDTSETDRYDRTLAYVWTALPASVDEALDAQVIAASMVNAWLVMDGYAQPRTYKPDTLHDGLFATWGDEALADGRGVTAAWQ